MTPSLGEKCLKKSNLTDLTNGFSSLNEKLCCSGFYHKKKITFTKKQVFASNFFPNEWKNQKAFRPIDFVMLGTPREVLEGSWFGHQTAIATPLDIQFSVEMNN